MWRASSILEQCLRRIRIHAHSRLGSEYREVLRRAEQDSCTGTSAGARLHQGSGTDEHRSFRSWCQAENCSVVSLEDDSHSSGCVAGTTFEDLVVVRRQDCGGSSLKC